MSELQPSKVEQRKEEKRRKLIEAAAELFAKQGYEQTTISQIVQQVGVAQGTFYLYFESKEQIRMAIHEQIIDEVVAVTEENNRYENMTHMERLIKSIQYSFEVMSRHKDLMMVIHREVYGSMIYDEESRAMNRKVLIPLAQLLQAGKEAGEFKVSNPHVVAHLLISMVERTCASSLLWEEPVPMDELFPEVVEFVRNALVK